MATPVSRSARAMTTVDGVAFQPDVEGLVESVLVDDQIDLPTMFAITLIDPARDILERAGLRIGAAVEIAVFEASTQEEKPLTQGEVVSVECEYDETGARVTVRGYAQSHRLHRGRRTRTFINVTDSELVKKVADEAGIDIDTIEPTTEVHDYVAQANMSDWEFISARARQIGSELAIVNGKLRFGRPREATAAPPESPPDLETEPADPRQLVSAKNLIAFRGRLSSAAQVKQIEVRGWDSDRKEPVVATVAAGTVAAGLDGAAPASLAETFGGHSFVTVDGALETGSEVDHAAKALAERIGSSFVEADGIAHGRPELTAGAAVYVSGVGEEFSGRYTLSHVRHVIDGEGYHTQFTVSGRQNRSLLGVVASAVPGPASARSAGAGHVLNGLVRGIVDDNADPANLGRVRVRLPWLADDFVSNWAPVMQLGAGPDRGTMFLPSVNDEVLVGFEHGKIDWPVVIGGMFNALDKPPTYGHMLDNGAVIGRSIVSRLGHEVAFLDDDGRLSGVHVATAHGTVSVALDAVDRKLVLLSDGAIEIRAQGEMKLSAAKMTLEAEKQLVLKGARIELN